MGEVELAAILCSLFLGGDAEVRHPFSAGYDLSRIEIDCETDTHVIEVGLDKRSSLDSVQQALFAASLTGKEPMVYIIDTDGRVGKYEYRIRTAAQMVGIEYRTDTEDWIYRQQMTHWLRHYDPLSSGEPVTRSLAEGG